jgi:hypothetical protein
VADGKPTEPQALKAALAELTGHYPLLRRFTAGALFTRRPAARVILEADRDFLFAVKDNRPAGFRDAADRPPDARTAEKKGARSIPASSGPLKARRSPRSAKRPHAVCKFLGA